MIRRNAHHPFAKVKHPTATNGPGAKLSLQRAIVKTISTLRNAPQPFAKVKQSLLPPPLPNGSSAKLSLQRAVVNTIPTLSNAPLKFAIRVVLQ